MSKQLLDEKGPLSHGFYTSGQLFLEEYYTLAVIGKAGLGTPHMDGNTRLCTATSAAAFKESFGADGQPGSYTDIEHCDAIFLYGHNMPETQTVLWTRILDRTRGEDPPRIVCVDPRRTAVAEEAERTGGVHLAPRVGTNLALMNGLTRELFVHGWVDDDWVGEHTIGVDELRDDRRAVHARARRRRSAGSTPTTCAERRGSSARASGVLSTVLQGFYQSHQATAASVAVHNLHLLRGMIGRPGAGRAADERPADRAEQPRVRRRRRPAGVPQLGQPRRTSSSWPTLWNVDVDDDPALGTAHPRDADHVATPRPGRSASCGSRRPTPPSRCRSPPGSVEILAGDQCFVVVQDLFLTETAELADVVLPAAGWGEKTGCFTNVNRTVHLSETGGRAAG